MRVVAVSLFARNGRGRPTKYAAQFLYHMKRVSGTHGEALANWHVGVFHDGSLPPLFWATLRFYFPRVLEVDMGASRGVRGVVWRFLVHDMPEVTAYYVMDVDSAFCKQDFEFIRALESGDYDAVVGTPRWSPHRMCPGAPLEIDAGGFGMIRGRFDFSMRSLIDAYAKKHAGSNLGEYGCDECFLTEYLAPLLRGRNVYTRGRVYPSPPQARDFYGLVDARTRLQDGARVDAKVAAVLQHLSAETGCVVTRTRSARRKNGSTQRPFRYILRCSARKLKPASRPTGS